MSGEQHVVESIKWEKNECHKMSVTQYKSLPENYMTTTNIWTNLERSVRHGNMGRSGHRNGNKSRLRYDLGLQPHARQRTAFVSRNTTTGPVTIRRMSPAYRYNGEVHPLHPPLLQASYLICQTLCIWTLQFGYFCVFRRRIRELKRWMFSN